MLSDINSKREQLWQRFQDKERRDNWAASHLGTSLASQIFSLREARGWTQRELADKVGMAQSRISVLEDPDYEKFAVATLKRLASAFDVVFVGRFVPFSEMLEWATDLTPEKLAPREFTRDVPPLQFDASQEREKQKTESIRVSQKHQRKPTATQPEEPEHVSLFDLLNIQGAHGSYGYGGPPKVSAATAYGSHTHQR